MVIFEMQCEVEEARPRLADNCANLKLLNFWSYPSDCALLSCLTSLVKFI